MESSWRASLLWRLHGNLLQRFQKQPLFPLLHNTYYNWMISSFPPSKHLLHVALQQ